MLPVFRAVVKFMLFAFDSTFLLIELDIANKGNVLGLLLDT